MANGHPKAATNQSFANRTLLPTRKTFSVTRWRGNHDFVGFTGCLGQCPSSSLTGDSSLRSPYFRATLRRALTRAMEIPWRGIFNLNWNFTGPSLSPPAKATESLLLALTRFPANTVRSNLATVHAPVHARAPLDARVSAATLSRIKIG